MQAEYAGDPAGEYAPLFSSGSFTEFIAATSETDIPPFPAGPFPGEVTPDPYQPPATAVPDLGAPGFGVPGSDAHDEPGATDDGTPDVQSHGTWDEPDATDDGTPDVQGHGTWDGSGHTAPDGSGHDDPAVPGGLTPGMTSADHPAGPDGGETGTSGWPCDLFAKEAITATLPRTKSRSPTSQNKSRNRALQIRLESIG